MLTVNFPAFHATALATGEGFIIGRRHVIDSRGNQLGSLAFPGGCNRIEDLAQTKKSCLIVVY